MGSHSLSFKEKKCCVLIPTYNNAGTLQAVLDDVLKYTSDIVVVNDGSKDNTAEILSRYKEITVVTQPENGGKGFALRTGFKKAIEQGYEYAITIDSDGQHFASDLPVFLDSLTANPNAVIIGSRNMEQEAVPGKSSFGNKFSNFWFKLETGINLPDTQSGYRLYPIKKLNNFYWITRKYEFEIEVIVRTAWAGINVLPVPVKVYYAPKEERISHFRPFKDFSRISVLNTFLVLITFLWIKPRNFFRYLFSRNPIEIVKELFLNPNETDAVKVLSVGFGLFMGVFPVWGFQMLIGLAICHLFKLNKAVFLLFANISLPPFIPFILWGSHFVGGYLVSHPTSIQFAEELTLEMVQQQGLQYLFGAVALSFILGFIGSVGAWGLLIIQRR